jgi:uncharacterized protein YdhG (YjbR/CyaY superfamily)
MMRVKRSDRADRSQITKGSLKFPYGQRIPLALISKTVKFRVRENLERARARTRAKER